MPNEALTPMLLLSGAHRRRFLGVAATNASPWLPMEFEELLRFTEAYKGGRAAVGACARP